MFPGVLAYLDSIKARDPAPRSRWEILLYPGIWALGSPARQVFKASSISSRASSPTRSAVHRHRHPSGAEIGRNCFSDHGFVVIGETASIGTTHMSIL